MWICSKCREQVDGDSGVCWNCGTSHDGTEDPGFVRETEGERDSRQARFQRDEPDESGSAAHSVDQLIFVGLNGYALALDRDTGDIVWSNSEMHSGYVALLLDGDRLIASTSGYMYCLNPLTGRIRWHNPLRGYMTGVPSLTSVRGQSSPAHLLQAAEATTRRQSS